MFEWNIHFVRGDIEDGMIPVTADVDIWRMNNGK